MQGKSDTLNKEFAEKEERRATVDIPSLPRVKGGGELELYIHHVHPIPTKRGGSAGLSLGRRPKTGSIDGEARLPPRGEA